jgi:beta-N-acetylhexosaminidase
VGQPRRPDRRGTPAVTARRRSVARVLLTLLGLAVVAAAGIILVQNKPPSRVKVRTVTTPRTVSTPGRAAPQRPRPAQSVSPDRLLGQLVVARFAGSRPPAEFLQRVHRGQIGGVVLFADNISPSQTTTLALTRELQAAARAGGNPPLLIMADQEGGEVRRVPGPPDLNPSQMETPATALAEGKAAGALLRSVGINMDLAPVADVEGPNGSFLGPRSFGGSAALVADRACAFATGLASQHVGYTLKHFPGLGLATTSTDDGPVTIPASSADLRADYMPYVRCSSNPMAMIMVSSAVYPSLTGSLPAVMSPLTYDRELPIAAQHTAVPTISDDLQAPALANQPAPARSAINAGLDMAMYAQTETASADAYRELKGDIATGQISGQRIRAAAQAVLHLKHAILGG